MIEYTSKNKSTESSVKYGRELLESAMMELGYFHHWCL